MTAGIVIGAVIVVLVILVAWTWNRGSKAKAELAARYPPLGQMVDVGGYRMHIHCQGNHIAGSPTVVMVGGNVESCLSWALVQPEVAKFARVCTYDRAGLGWSELSSRQRTATNIVEELYTLLTQAGVEPPYVLVGHSIGGLFVRFYAHKHPDQVVGMVLVDVSHEEQDQRWSKTFQRLNQLTLRLMVWGMRLFKMLNSIGLLALAVDKMGRRWPSPIPETVREMYIGIVCSDTRFFATAADETASVGESLAQVRAARIDSLGEIPLVVLSAGELPISEGPGMSAEEVERYQSLATELHTELVSLSPNGKRMVAEECGHYIHVDRPDLVIDAIREVVEATQKKA